MFLIVETRLDIVFATSVVAQFAKNLGINTQSSKNNLVIPQKPKKVRNHFWLSRQTTFRRLLRL